jgi:uncharacterized protein (DUF2062 family)
MQDRLRSLLPSADAVRAHRWLRWFGPALHHPRLWHLSRRGIAMGVALGLFFGLLVPIAQIPLSAAAAVLLRANLPCAIASTLVTNPVTFGPVYFAAWKVGGLVLGETGAPPRVARPAPPGPWWRTLRERVVGIGKPLAVGLGIFAVVAGVGAYLLVTWVWWARVNWLRWRRLARRAARPAP